MKLTSLIPMLRTWEMEATIAYYTEILGFTCDAYSAEWNWTSLKKDHVMLMLSGPNEHEGDSEPLFTGSLYFIIDEVDAFWEQVKDRVQICYAPETFPYGMREFGVYDNNGYLLQFGQSIGP